MCKKWSIWLLIKLHARLHHLPAQHDAQCVCVYCIYSVCVGVCIYHASLSERYDVEKRSFSGSTQQRVAASI